MSPSDELLALSSVEMRRRIGTKEISPVELVDASIGRIEALNPAVNAIAAADFARARKLAMSAESAARKGEQLGPLHGLPTGIKDLHETAGLLTTYGSPLYRSHVPAHDAAMVALVRKAGAIILCKTNVPEFGAGANTRNVVWGATGNPFDPRLNAGGSSGGWRSRSPATCSRSAPDPIPGGPCGYLPRSAALWVFVLLPASCRRMAGHSAGRRSRCWAPWAAASRICGFYSRPRSEWTTASRWRSRSIRLRSRRRGRSISADCASLSPTILDNAR
jgi:hypothetical protein